MASRKYLKVRLELENGFTKDVGKVKQEDLKEYLKAFQDGRKFQAELNAGLVHPSDAFAMGYNLGKSSDIYQTAFKAGGDPTNQEGELKVD